jgi:hypothetical protein
MNEGDPTFQTVPRSWTPEAISCLLDTTSAPQQPSVPYGGCPRFEKNRPIESDSCRNRAKFELRNFPFEIKSEKI